MKIIADKFTPAKGKQPLRQTFVIFNEGEEYPEKIELANWDGVVVPPGTECKPGRFVIRRSAVNGYVRENLVVEEFVPLDDKIARKAA